MSGNGFFSALSSFFIYDESKNSSPWRSDQTGVARYLDEQNHAHEQALERAANTGVGRYLANNSSPEPEDALIIPQETVNTGVGRYLMENVSLDVSVEDDVSTRRVIVEVPEQTNNQDVQPSSGGILGAISSFFIYKEPVSTAPVLDSGVRQGDTGVDIYLAEFATEVAEAVEVVGVAEVAEVAEMVEELDAQPSVETNQVKESLQTGVALYLNDNLEAPITSVSKYLSKQILAPAEEEPEVLSGVAQYLSNQELEASLAFDASGVSNYLTSITQEQLLAESKAIITRYREEHDISLSFKGAMKPIIDRDYLLAYENARESAKETPSGVTKYLSERVELDNGLPTPTGVDQYLLQQKVSGGDINTYSGVDKYLITLTGKPEVASIELEGTGVERYLVQ